MDSQLGRRRPRVRILGLYSIGHSSGTDYLAAATIGLPIVAFLAKRRLLDPVSIAILGFLIGFIELLPVAIVARTQSCADLMTMLEDFGEPAKWVTHPAAFWTGFWGIVAAFVFWIVARPRVNHAERTPAKPSTTWRASTSFVLAAALLFATGGIWTAIATTLVRSAIDLTAEHSRSRARLEVHGTDWSEQSIQTVISAFADRVSFRQTTSLILDPVGASMTYERADGLFMNVLVLFSPRAIIQIDIYSGSKSQGIDQLPGREDVRDRLAETLRDHGLQVKQCEMKATPSAS